MSSNKKTATKVYDRVSINDKLKEGEKATIASRTGFSVSHVTNVLAGRRNNNDIMATANKITSRRK